MTSATLDRQSISTQDAALRAQRSRTRAIGMTLGGLAALFYIVTIFKFLVMLGA